MPQPQSTAFFLLLLVIFAALMCWLVLTRHVVLKVLAACLAFLPAVMFGVAAVNKYYDYYQTWNSAIADVTSAGVPGTVSVPVGVSQPGNEAAGRGVTSLLGVQVITKLAQTDGYTVTMRVRGQLSHLTRTVYVYLPPQYFQPGYRNYKFPAIELIHGYPGAPQDWITVLDVTSTLAGLISQHLAEPAVLVMPDANGARGISLQCLNSLDGPQDATFIARDVPDYISRVLRVWPPGRAWGIAGYSEGGFCAANLGLQYGRYFGVAGVLSGYFSPADNQEGTPPRLVNPFGGDTQLRRENTPMVELLRLPPGASIPQFWIGSGTDRADARAATAFRQLVELRQPAVQLEFVRGGGHTMATWRVLVPQLLKWMTPKLAINVKLAQARARRLASHHLASHHLAPRRPASSVPQPRSRTRRVPAARTDHPLGMVRSA